MLKKLGLSVVLGVCALGLAACGQQNNNKDAQAQASQPSVAQKLKAAGDQTADAVKQAGQKAADAAQKAKDSIQKMVKDHSNDSAAATPAATAKAPAPTKTAPADSTAQ